jgi:hypothetical protein
VKDSQFLYSSDASLFLSPLACCRISLLIVSLFLGKTVLLERKGEAAHSNSQEISPYLYRTFSLDKSASTVPEARQSKLQSWRRDERKSGPKISRSNFRSLVPLLLYHFAPCSQHRLRVRNKVACILHKSSLIGSV